MMEALLAVFAIMGIIGLIGTIYAYAQPSAKGWWVVFVFMLIVGALGFLIALIYYLLHLATGG